MLSVKDQHCRRITTTRLAYILTHLSWWKSRLYRHMKTETTQTPGQSNPTNSDILSPTKALIVPPHLSPLLNPRRDTSPQLARHRRGATNQDGDLFSLPLSERVVNNLLQIRPLGAPSRSGAPLLQAVHLDSTVGDSHVACEEELHLVIIEEGLSRWA